MIATFIHEGKTIDYVSATDIPAGSVIVQGDLVGITTRDLKTNELGGLVLTGVFDIEKASGAVTAGAKVYWDSSAKKATTTATGNTLLGLAVYDAAAGSQTVVVRLNS